MAPWEGRLSLENEMSLLDLLGLKPPLAGISSSVVRSASSSARGGSQTLEPQSPSVPSSPATTGSQSLPPQTASAPVGAKPGGVPQHPPSAADRNAAIRSIDEAWQNLNDLNETAAGIVERAGGHVPPPTRKPYGPDPRVSPTRQRQQTRPAHNTPEVKEALQRIVDSKGELAAEARKALEQIEAIQKELGHLNAQLRDMPRDVPPRPQGGGPPPTGSATNPSEPAGPGGTGGPAQNITPSVEEYSRQAKELADKAKAIEAEEKTFQKQAADARRSFDSGKTDPDTFLKQNAEIEKKVSALATRRDALAGKASSMQTQAESMVAKLGKEMPTELEEAFKTNNPREILERVRTGKGAATLGGMLSVLGVLATGYFLVQSIRYVLDAKGGLAKAERALEVGGTLAAGLGLEALIAEIAASGAIGAVAVAALSVDDHNPIPAMEAREKQLKQMNAQESHAIAVFLEKNAPGSVRNNGEAYEILDQDLWNKTVEQVHEMQASEQSKNRAKLLNRARDLGAADGRSGLGFVRASDMKEWDEVVKSERPIDTLRELLRHYQAGYKKGNVDQAVLIERVRKIGTADGEAGTKRDRDRLLTTKETAAFIQAGTSLPTLISKVYAAYDESYTAAAVRRGMPALSDRPSKPDGRR
jgi:hypothetical protein